MISMEYHINGMPIDEYISKINKENEQTTILMGIVCLFQGAVFGWVFL